MNAAARRWLEKNGLKSLKQAMEQQWEARGVHRSDGKSRWTVPGGEGAWVLPGLEEDKDEK